MKKLSLAVVILLSVTTLFGQSSTLWEISGKGLSKPSYLLGTLKFIGEKEFTIPAVVEEKMAAATIFAIEDQVDHRHQHELSKAVHLADGKKLSAVLSASDYETLVSTFGKEFGIGRTRFEAEYAHLIPLALSITMTRLSLGEAVKYYDIELLMLAKKKKLKTFSLETIEREAEAIRAFPMEDQAKALVHSVQHFDVQKSEYRKLVDAYLKGDIDAVFDYSMHPTENNPRFAEEFFSKRNREWMPKLDKMMHEESSFITVGVSHLEGESGLLNLLRQSGYTLKAIPVAK